MGGESKMRFGTNAVEFLKENNEKKYKELVKNGELKNYENEINERAKNYYNTIMAKLLEKNPVKDQNDFMARVQHMNKLKAVAEELTLNDIIYNK